MAVWLSFGLALALVYEVRVHSLFAVNAQEVVANRTKRITTSQEQAAVSQGIVGNKN